MKYPIFYGDIHNHCDRSYAHGSLDNALQNARLQLDFVSVTGHSSWPDIPESSGRLGALVEYHERGFKKLEDGWNDFVNTFERFNEPGRFICFPSYEIHSMADGDHTVYFKDYKRPLIKPDSISEFRSIVHDVQAHGGDAMLTPHHIGYRQGYRGINWNTFDEIVSPVVEIVSMHGCAESDESPMKYLHTMGPRNGSNTMQAGLARGFHFGVIGSTDHHSAHPGSHGYGKVAVLAASLTHASIWEALKSRRCYALTGDRIAVDFTVNDSPMGSVIAYTPDRSVRLSVSGGDAIDFVELIKNNRVHRRWDTPDGNEATMPHRGKLTVEVGWGETGIRTDWSLRVRVAGGNIVAVEPRFHGVDVLDPSQLHARDYQFSDWSWDDDTVAVRTSSWGNLTASTDSNQAVCLEIEGNATTRVEITANGHRFEQNLTDLVQRSESFYLDRFLSGAVHLHRFVPERLYQRCYFEEDRGTGEREDCYYVRIRQKNGQWAFTSPIWVKSC